MVYCTECKRYFHVTFPNDKKLSDNDVKHCPICGKEIVREKTKILGTVIAVAFIFMIILAGLFLNWFRLRGSSSTEAEAVSMNYTTISDKWELEEEDEFEWDEI